MGPYGLGALVAAVVALVVMKSYLPGYLAEKGKNLATREDFESLLEQIKRMTLETEGIKTELSRHSWLSQQQWKLREQYYVELVDNLFKLKLTLDERSNYFLEPGSEHSQEHTQTPHFNEQSRLGAEAFRRVQQLTGHAALFLSPRTLEAVEELAREQWHVDNFSICTADFLESSATLVTTAYTRVLEEAKGDLNPKK